MSTFRTRGLSKEQVATWSGGTWRAELTGFESVSLCSCLTLPDQQRLRLKSPVLKKQACPQWKHSFIFKGVTPSQLRQSSLELTVWDQATFGVNDRFLGGARLGLKEDLPGGVHTSSQAKLQWQKVLSSPNLWTDMTLILH